MMGGHHAASGAAAWVAVTSTAPIALGLYPVSDVGVITGALVCAGAALLPDADHHSGTIAHSLPPVSERVTRAIAALAGGHRGGTHSLLGVAVFTAIAWAAGQITVTTQTFGEVLIGPGIMAVLLVSFALRALKITRTGTAWSWLASLSLAVLIAVYAPEEWYWMPFSVGLGCLVHIVGDLLTTNGVPLLWPIRVRSPRWVRRYPVLPFDDVWRRGGNVSLPLLGDAGSWREWLVMTPVSVYAVVGVGGAALNLLGVDAFAIWDASATWVVSTAAQLLGA
ncbi:membrane-bound metal-dependent hydrolase [Xylanimonas cellulosilytica DSM 15894]|uniref:Membrane-bound metal-dependent hydrolase n=1 Tax=Xylanimonas cellulosilytica (strain DSM 15894 / JCM 12276 / CECT 5975 / KCTC 9989 / LMG 20990 / NBRC 107835 / XIL07) TaxID=446471 RepID=D1BRY4_XYLCX|nr:metal-dependent hydrolase [Xylanimonas cellulosilytica]ACZ30476.1 membrane-bound metal-dependent hydrolase [Xylanimonas cellulosilytica DSM 15894]